MTLKESVIAVIRDLPIGMEFSGRELQRWVCQYNKKAGRKYTETILRIARAYCRDDYSCINQPKSFYKRVDGRAYRVFAVKSLIRKGEEHSAKVACNDWFMNFDELKKEVENEKEND